MVDVLINKFKEKGELLTSTDLFGLIDPLVIPFYKTKEGCKVDTIGLTKLVKSVIPYVDALFPGGNAGEGSVIDFDNWTLCVKTVINTRDQYKLKYTPVLAGVLRDNVPEIVLFSKKAKVLGADAIVIAPMQNKDPEKALAAAIESTSIPIVLYGNPTLCEGRELSVDFIRKVKEMYGDRIIGIKSSTKDFELFLEILKLKDQNFRVLQGDTSLDARSLAVGADGIVPVESSLAPILFNKLYRSFFEKDKVLSENTEREVGLFVANLKTERESMQVNFAQIIKHFLTLEGKFQSSMMYTKNIEH
jgi:4-hydroxy-tetrahydrodipicolinate synthase